MVGSCWAPGCTNRLRKGPDEIKLFRFPHSNEERLTKWLTAIRRICGPDQTTRRKDGLMEPTNHSRLCSAHFVSGSPSHDQFNVDYVPSIFHRTAKIRKHSKTLKRKQVIHERPQELLQKQQKLDTALTLLSLDSQQNDMTKRHAFLNEMTNDSPSEWIQKLRAEHDEILRSNMFRSEKNNNTQNLSQQERREIMMEELVKLCLPAEIMELIRSHVRLFEAKQLESRYNPPAVFDSGMRVKKEPVPKIVFVNKTFIPPIDLESETYNSTTQPEIKEVVNDFHKTLPEMNQEVNNSLETRLHEIHQEVNNSLETRLHEIHQEVNNSPETLPQTNQEVNNSHETLPEIKKEVDDSHDFGFESFNNGSDSEETESDCEFHEEGVGFDPDRAEEERILENCSITMNCEKETQLDKYHPERIQMKIEREGKGFILVSGFIQDKLRNKIQSRSSDSCITSDSC